LQSERGLNSLLSPVRRRLTLRPIRDVAFLLGFSEQSALSHAFKRWTGKSPKAWLEFNRKLGSQRVHRPGIIFILVMKVFQGQVGVFKESPI